MPEYNDTIWLSWFGVLEDYRFKGYNFDKAKVCEDEKID